MTLVEDKCGRLVKNLVIAVQWILNFAFLNINLLLFRADSVTQWTQILKRLFVINLDVRSELVETFRIPKLTALLSAIGANASEGIILGISTAFYLGLSLYICLCTENNYNSKCERNAFNLVSTWILFVLCLISLSTISTFLYFNF